MPDPRPAATSAPNQLATLLATLRRTGLLTSAQLAEIERRPEASGDDPKPLGRQLLAENVLTRYQLNQLVAGRDEDLVLGPYCLIDRVAEGGGGQVFKARHRVMNRIVALKRIRPERFKKTETSKPVFLEQTGTFVMQASTPESQPKLVERFFQEAQVAAQLDHPNVVRSHDAGQVGDNYFLVMEYVDGLDLTRLVREGGPLPVHQALDFIRQAALGLQHAHDKRMVHRDVKPSNLLATPIECQPGQPVRPADDAVVKVLDLGLARWQTQETEPNASTSTVGSPHFIAPEQIRNADAADARADLYSLGCTLFFLLTGRTPFESDSVAGLLWSHLNRMPPRVEKLRPRVPTAVGDLVERLAEKDPAARFQTAAELADALEELRDRLSTPTKHVAPDDSVLEVNDSVELKVVARPVGRSGRFASKAVEVADAEPGPNRWLFAAAVGLPLAAFALLVFLVIYWLTRGPAEPVSALSTSPAASCCLARP